MNIINYARRAMVVISLMILSPVVQAQDITTNYTPSGPYEVGVTARHWVDENRGEIYTDDPNDNKTVTVWIWYPADVEEGMEPAPYLENPEQYWAIDDLSMQLGTTRSEVEAYMSTLVLSAYQDAPVAAAMTQYPVVVYFDPLSGLPINQSVQVQDLASHGYIVVSILHAYGFDVAFGEQMLVGDASFDYSFVEWMGNALPDVSFTIDQLASLNSEEQFAQRLDLNNIGLSGYSLGGSIAAMATAEDDRIKAAISQDGLPPAFDFASIEQPYLIFEADGDFHDAFTQFGGPTYLVASDQLIHDSFSDDIYWPHNLDLPDEIVDAVRGTQIINAYLIAFFDHYLKGENQLLLLGPSDDFPEVTIESRNLDG